VIDASSDVLLTRKKRTKAPPAENTCSNEMFVNASSSDGMLADERLTNPTSPAQDPHSDEVSRSATFANWALAGKEQINPVPLDSPMTCYGRSRPMADCSAATRTKLTR
jgi:hypothetical protein